MTEKVQHEMIRLFGVRTVRCAATTEPASIIGLGVALMARVHDAADAVLARHGHPRHQITYAKGLSTDVRLVLCMWLMDATIAAKLIHAVYVDGRRQHVSR